ncbi:hypothetical protein SEA_CHEWYVIII_3 [Rhodococcus phage ChewyVIII]|uniref:Uncharacterized protein n=1 Tax=Rhodococcus phage ChewyVIII TaxID=1887657 RepID=A0A1C9EI17_9CAUD|nr:hypothetical protein QEH30_gp03 [Rhodococcus phage ChewyVIII]AON97426.1 hypothetical protein SEA_CHEWYVIII_3 [Rhodococcus phage ChewyVIII]
MIVGIVAGVFVAAVIWWLLEIDKEWERDRVNAKIQRHYEIEKQELYMAKTRLEWELDRAFGRVAARMECINDEITWVQDRVVREENHKARMSA